MYVLIALLHAVPVFAIAAITNSKFAIGLTAAVMACVGVFTGAPPYMLLDIAAVGVATWVGLSTARPTSNTEPSQIGLFFAGMLKDGVSVVSAVVLVTVAIVGTAIVYNRFFGDCADSKLVVMKMTFKECRATHTKKR